MRGVTRPMANLNSGGAWDTFGTTLGLTGLGNVLNSADALQLGAVCACLDVIAQDISKVPLQLFKHLPNGRERVKPNEHTIASLLNLQVNPFQTRNQFLAQLVYNLKLWGNAYVFIKESMDGKPVALYSVPSPQVTVLKTESGEISYRCTISSDVDQVAYGEHIFNSPARLTIHIRQRSISGLMGVGAMSVGTRYFDLANKLAAYRDRLYESNGMVNGLFQQSAEAQPLSDEAFARLDSELRERFESFRNGQMPLLLEQGLTYKAQQLDADESQVANALQRELTDACRLFRVPPHKIAALESVKYDNIDPMERSYASEALDPTMVDIELAFAAHLLTGADRDNLFFEFDRARLQVVDYRTKIDAAAQLFESGLVSRNEARATIGLNPDADDLQVIRGAQAVVSSDGVVTYPGQAKDV